jgi:small-conductance mechanosensitive channel
MDANALLAALGIGGIAIALAVQTILGDLFASVSIALDKPFVIGDLITVDQMSGNVEYIGLKSTRLRSVTGEQLVFSNADLLSRAIRNFQRLERRRVIFIVGVDYNTPTEKLAALPATFQQVVEAQAMVTFERAHLKVFGSQALNFEIAYVLDSPDAKLYLDTQQAVNLAICQRLAEEGIQLASPSQVMFTN